MNGTCTTNSSSEFVVSYTIAMYGQDPSRSSGGNEGSLQDRSKGFVVFAIVFNAREKNLKNAVHF